MIDPLPIGLVQMELFPMLLVAVLAFTGATPAFAALAGAGPSELRGTRGLLAGATFGITLWGAAVVALLVGGKTPGFDAVAIALALVVALFGGIVTVCVLYPLDGETGAVLAGALLAGTAGAVGILTAASKAPLLALDPVVLIIAWVAAWALAASGLLLARMRLGPGTIFGGAGALAALLAVSHYGSTHGIALSTVEAQVPLGLWSAGEVAAVLVATLLLVPALAALGWVASMRSIEGRLAAAEAEAERQKALAALLIDDVRVPMSALSGCLEFMASEPLPLVQRSRLDMARACAREVEALFDGATGLDVTEPAATASKAETRSDEVSVLVVDDAEVHRSVATAMLRRLGVHITVARDGEEALSLLRKAPRDLVLMDTEMPRLGGFAATAALRLDPHLKDIPVVGLSADVAADKADAYEAGMDDIIAKPLSLERLTATLERWCPERLPAPPVPEGSPAGRASGAESSVFWRGATV